jgi:hypothetical protein
VQLRFARENVKFAAAAARSHTTQTSFFSPGGVAQVDLLCVAAHYSHCAAPHFAFPRNSSLKKESERVCRALWLLDPLLLYQSWFYFPPCIRIWSALLFEATFSSVCARKQERKREAGRVGSLCMYSFAHSLDSRVSVWTCKRGSIPFKARMDKKRRTSTLGSWEWKTN